MADELPPPVRLTIKVLHGAMLGSVVIYGVVAYLVSMDAERGEAPAGLLLGLIAAGLATLAASLWLPGMLSSDERVLGAMRRGDPSKPLSGGLGTETPAAGRHPLMVGASVLFVGFILRLALTEAVAVYGLVLSLISMNPTYAWAFGAFAFAFMALTRFDEEHLMELYRRL